MTNKTPHIHAALIKEWADGAVIQFENCGIWTDCGLHPAWSPLTRYRVKPEPKPDVVRYNVIEFNPRTNRAMLCLHGRDNVMFVFDGETGELKDCQVLAHE